MFSIVYIRLVLFVEKRHGLAEQLASSEEFDIIQINWLNMGHFPIEDNSIKSQNKLYVCFPHYKKRYLG